MILVSESQDEIVFQLDSGIRFRVSPEDKYLICNRTWTLNVYGYVVVTNAKKNRTDRGKQLSRLICKSDNEVDHKDLDPLNNRRDNLRPATKSQNGANRHTQPNSKVGLKGVKRNHHRFMARGKLNGVEIYLGTYDTSEEAHQVYCEWAEETFGEFARFK